LIRSRAQGLKPDVALIAVKASSKVMSH